MLGNRICPARFGWRYLNRGYKGCNRWKNRQQSRIVGVSTAHTGSRHLSYRCHYRYGTRVCSGGIGFHARGGATLGTTFYTNHRVTSRLMRHERKHKKQWKRYGFRFGYMYLRAGSDPCRNWWERRAEYRDGGYRC